MTLQNTSIPLKKHALIAKIKNNTITKVGDANVRYLGPFKHLHLASHATFQNSLTIKLNSANYVKPISFTILISNNV